MLAREHRRRTLTLRRWLPRKRGCTGTETETPRRQRAF
jgi:hypothetical protein